MKLGELLEGKTLPVKVRAKFWKETEFFEVFIVINNHAIGFDETEFPIHIDINQTHYELYTEPKKPEILYEYLFIYPNGTRTLDFMTDDEFENTIRHVTTKYKKTGRSWPKDELENECL